MADKIRVTNWNTKEIMSLLRSLSEIPSHLYVPSADKGGRENINFVVVDLPDKLSKSEGHIPYKQCYCSKETERPHVILWKNTLTKEGKITGDARTVVHDLVHRFTDESIEELSEELLKSLKIKEFKGIQERFFAYLEGRFSHDSLVVTGYKTHLGFGATSVREFLSVASEYYIQGQETFHKTYKLFFNIGERKALYQFLKEKIFQEKL